MADRLTHYKELEKWWKEQGGTLASGKSGLVLWLDRDGRTAARQRNPGTSRRASNPNEERSLRGALRRHLREHYS